MAELADNLFDRLLAASIRGTKTLANIAFALKQPNLALSGKIERCPHCGGRSPYAEAARRVINAWIEDGAP
jgi:hypothetical protein